MPSNNDYQQNIVLRRTPPSAQSLSEGQIVFALAPNRGMYMYTKRNGQVWIAPFQKQQDKQILNDLEVKNNVKFLKDLTIYGDLNLKGATIVGVGSTVSTASHQDAYDVRGISIIPIDVTSNDVRFGGFANGVNGQIIHLVLVAGTSNAVYLEHNESSGTQKMKLAESSDLNWSDYGGWSLFCDGTTWFQLSPNFN